MTAPNPIPHHDYLVELNETTTWAFRVRYVPDRVVIDPAEFAALCHAIPSTASPEQAGGELITKLADLLVPRWLEVCCISPSNQHRVTIEDRQPGWHNAAFLDRLERLG
jgi:7-cyano-7-deazaguanine reductase